MCFGSWAKIVTTAIYSNCTYISHILRNRIVSEQTAKLINLEERFGASWLDTF